MVNAAFLKNIPLFFGFTPGECRVILSLVKEKTLPAAKTIFKEGQRGDALYVIVSGSVMIEKQPLLKSTGALSTLCFKAGDFFGELALFDYGPRTSSARTIEKTTLLSLGQKEFIRLLKDSPLALKYLKNSIQIIAGRIRQVNQELMVFYELGRILSQRHTIDSLCTDALAVLALSLKAEQAGLFLHNEITGQLDEKASWAAAKVTFSLKGLIDGGLAERLIQDGRVTQDFRRRPVLFIPFGTNQAKKGLIVLAGKAKAGRAKNLSRRHKTAPLLAGRMEAGRDSAQQGSPCGAPFTPDQVNLVSPVARLFETALENTDYRSAEQSRQRLKRRYISF